MTRALVWIWVAVRYRQAIRLGIYRGRFGRDYGTLLWLASLLRRRERRALQAQWTYVPKAAA